MRTTVKIETATRILEVELKFVDGKQIVEVELAELLEMLGEKAVKIPAAPKAPKVAKAAKAAKPVKAAKAEKVAKEPKAAVADKPASTGAKRGRKPKAAVTVSEGISEPTE
ncbi:MAG: hypothetical protein A2Z99_10755 [Treponema sp. GWB1_62_6]|nr:MAG: hypothetical protein A2Z99_10755 [Treponema sp. GWB1_62_6]OHE62799.1 MAG: hypothetical protein A2Y36_06295 [Treponema sp. GWA1_62_8]OHE63461.1 MAG: hypothetical protein A2001_03345 [Treponema sp. GWC1_61_84]OHE68570.1 MAG: hypothetical protein A2413_12540 [Treponema sp. RIFOXYC1_FULL_61_9]HCM26502.1 hypothetical protein [Treponema sp.]